MTADIHDVAAAYALDAVSPQEARDFERHLVSCESCAIDVREFRETVAALAVSAAQQPPEQLRDRVLADAASLEQATSSGASVTSLTERRSTRSRANRWLAGVAAAALLVAGALGVATYQANERADDAQVTAEQVAAVLADPSAELERGDITGGGRGTLVVSASSGAAVFLTEDLPDAGADQTYQLWAINDEGATSVGLLSPDEGQASELVELPSGFTNFGMTVEPGGGSEQPTTDPVLLLDLPSA